MNTAVRIRIVRLQGYVGPQWLKQAWIGSEVVCITLEETMRIRGTGIMEKEIKEVPGALFDTDSPGVEGYFFRQDAAINMLSKRHPSAAEWYRNKCCPQPGGHFLIEASNVEVLPAEA